MSGLATPIMIVSGLRMAENSAMMIGNGMIDHKQPDIGLMPSSL